MKIETVEMNWTEKPSKRLHDIIGNEMVKRAIEVALVGNHEIVFLSTINSPASDLLQATTNIAKINNIPFKGSVIPVCPCGAFGNPKEECTCSNASLKKYAKKVHPMLKKAMIIVETLAPCSYENTSQNEHEDRIISRIKTARQRNYKTNQVDPNANELLKMAVQELGIDRESAILVANTISNMEGSDSIQAQHIAEAVQYRNNHVVKWVDDFQSIVV